MTFFSFVSEALPSLHYNWDISTFAWYDRSRVRLITPPIIIGVARTSARDFSGFDHELLHPLQPELQFVLANLHLLKYYIANELRV